MSAKLTVNRGAGLERTAILAKVRRMRRSLFTRNASESVLDEWDNLIAWIGERHNRYAKKPGTLKGRK
jgi:hypothetical protein